MAHLLDGRDRFQKTPTEWLPFGQQVGAICNMWADRDDIIAFVGEGAGQGIATACWAPASAEMEINIKEAFGEGVEAYMVDDFTERDTHFEFPQVAGAALHEAMHARHTKFPLEDMFKLRQKLDTFAISHIIEWLEETRIERQGIRHWPKNRAFLRSSALKLSLSDMDEIDEKFKQAHVMNMSKLILLSLARVDAGVLEADDVKKIRDIAADALGGEVLEKLQDIWVRAQAWDKDDDMSGLRKLAEEWVDLLKEEGHDPDPEVVGAPGQGEGEKGDGDGMEGAVQEATEAMEDAAEATEVAASEEATEQASDEHDEELQAARAEASKERDDADDASTKVFGASTSESSKTKTESRLITERPPTDEERAAAVIISRELEKARYRERWQTNVHTEMPPGRLSGRGAMLRDVQRQQGRRSTATPFSTRRRFHTEDPRLKMGLMTDISGSMNAATLPMAVTNYVLSEAGRRIQAEVASVYYGSGVFPGLTPGQHLEKVKVYRAGDSVERFHLAFKALDGKLELLQGTGARLLVIVSDMIYSGDEPAHLKHWLARCQDAGVAVISLPVTTDRTVKIYTAGYDVEIIDGAMNPVAVAMKIGRAAAEQLTKAGTRDRR